MYMAELNCNHDYQKIPGSGLVGERNGLLIKERMKQLKLEADMARIYRTIIFKEMDKQ